MPYLRLPTAKQLPGHRHSAGGFTLIEVLVSMIVLAIGITGTASMQVSTYKQLQTSHNMANASTLAGEFADRMRANASAALDGDYIHDRVPSEPRNCAALTCTPIQIADYDIAQWQRRVTGNIASGSKTPGSLPAGTAAVARIGISRDFTITVRWDDDLSGSTRTNCDALDPEAEQRPEDLDCQVVTIRI